MAPITKRQKGTCTLQKGKVWIYCRNLESIQSSKLKCKENLASWPVSENVVNETNGIVKAFQDFCSYGTPNVFNKQF